MNHNKNKNPHQIAGVKVGDRVKTPLGRIAIILAVRPDGFLDARYEGQHPHLAEVILQPHMLQKL